MQQPEETQPVAGSNGVPATAEKFLTPEEVESLSDEVVAELLRGRLAR
jgi:hypothetical protein